MIQLKAKEIFEYEPLPAYDVRRIGYVEARKFVTAHHYAKGCANTHSASFGLFEKDWMIGVLMFATPCSENVRGSVFGMNEVDRVTELHRLVILDVTPKNAESFFIARCLKQLKEIKSHLWSVVSFADPSQGHVGAIYQATNALYYGQGKSSSRFYLDQEGRLRHPRQCGVNISLAEATARGWSSVVKPPKHRYCFMLPDDKRHKVELFNKTQLERFPYPKPGSTSNGFTPLI